MVRICLAWAIVALVLITSLDNFFFQPQMPGLFIGGADFMAAIVMAIVVLDRAHHAFDIRK